MNTVAKPAIPVSIEQTNYEHLWNEIGRLRMLLRRRMLWLRKQGRSGAGFSGADAQADRLLAGDDRRGEADFYRTMPETRALETALAENERRGDLMAERLREAGAAPALDRLVSLFELSRFERDVIVLCLAPEWDGSFERLYGYLHDDAARRFPTPQLAFDLFTEGGDEARGARLSFQSCGRLRHFRLIAMEEGGGPLSPLRLAPRIAAYLMGVNQLDGKVEQVLEPVPPLPLAPQQSMCLDGLSRHIAERLEKGAWPRLNLAGPRDCGKKALARALCERLGLRLYRLDLEKAGAFDPEIWNLLERDSVLGQFALYLRCGEQARESLGRMEGLFGRLRVLLIAASAEPLDSEWPLMVIPVERPPAEDRGALWRQLLDSLPNEVDGEIAPIVEAFEFGPSGIARAVWQARSESLLREPDGGVITGGDLWNACRSQAGRGMGALAQPIPACNTWDDIVLPAEVERQLRAVADQVRNRHRVYTGWGFGASLNRGRGISALFAGPSGTGKTMAAEILAGDLGLNLYRIDLSAVVNKYIGETEKNLRRVFDAAEQSGAILLFDEADALFGKRSEVTDSHDRYANIEIDYLLQRMEEYRGLAILATNMKSALDAAFLRRLRFVVDFPFPGPGERRLIWEKSFPQGAPLDDIRYELLARLEIAGGNIRNIVLNGAFLAAAEDAAIGMRHLMRAAADEYAKEEKLVTAAEFGAYFPMVRRS
jgi:DNA polymerase III delta prime subunit